MVKKVITRDGKVTHFNPEKIRNAILGAAKEIYPLKKAQAVTENSLSKVIQRIRKYKKDTIHIEDIQDIVEESLMAQGFVHVAKAYILYRKFREEIRITKQKLGIKDELKLSLNAINVLRARYLLKNNQRVAVETPQQMFRRVADCIAKAERKFSSKKESFYRDKFYQILTSLEFLPNSPTLMNAGTALGQLSACFVLPVGDSIEGIFSSLKAMALIHQSGGGTGFSFSHLRPSGDIVFSTKGAASGPVSFMQVFDAATKVIVQGGRRRGANMAVLGVHHPDIVEFVESKLKEGGLENFNISVGVTADFMQAVKHNRQINLINPRTKKTVKRIKAKTLFSLIAFSAYRCADPGLLFMDSINRAHPLRQLGTIEATNPCGEIPLLAYESCNLASLNLSKCVRKKKVDWARLREVIHLGVRFLDNVIEVNRYPLVAIEQVTKKNRKIGLGIMGFADMLIRLRIPYNSQRAVTFCRQLMRFIRQCSLEASAQLAQERGAFDNWKRSTYRRKNIKVRNATLNSIAPTGSISILAGCSSGIEPLFGLSFARNALGGIKLFEMNSLIEEVAREEGFYSKRLMNRIRGEVSLKHTKGIPALLKNVFLTTFDILALDHLKIQAAFQEFTDNAVSKTINLSQEATIDDVQYIYLKAYELKLKGITIYRYGSKKEQVLTMADLSGGLSVEGEYSGSCFADICSI
ncbi:MAG: adenosylcobalamin-dependent ribonucleoside-diphosphate reductase [Candidatus Omnitrophota bacterium]|nr:MAG: adenosylcobalamin-dependent ribonucleoside-diphosphate reductase [Candidatus Omnitrophota bacterium]